MKRSDRPRPEETRIMRANCYRLLADAYQRPELLREGILHQLARTVGALYSQCEAPARALLDALGGMNDQTEALRVAHAKLFIGPRELLAPPYGSVYLDQEALVMGASTIDAAACYEKAGLSPEEQFLEPPDHVVTELEFMYFLAHRQVVTGEQGYLEDQRDFLAGHLGLWIAPFTAAIARAALHPYYTALARLTKVYIHADAEALNPPRQPVAAVG
ncbi:MAG: molecular chaperone TorD family protein [bacterium]